MRFNDLENASGRTPAAESLTLRRFRSLFAFSAAAAIATLLAPQSLRAAGSATASDRDPPPAVATDEDSGNSLRAITPSPDTPANPPARPAKAPLPAAAPATDSSATASDAAGDAPSITASDADAPPAGKVPPVPDSDDTKPLVDSPDSRSIVKSPNETPSVGGTSGGGTSGSGGSGFKTVENLPADPSLRIEPARFKSLQPGSSTMEELVKKWGPGVPSHGKDGSVSRVYKFDPYPRIVVSVSGRRVVAIDVQLDKPWDAEALAKRLKLNDFRAVPVLDDLGQPLGEAFPERGVLFSYSPATTLVTQMLLETIDAEPFVLRAAANSDLHPRRSLQDLDAALQIEPQNAAAHDLRAQILLSIGRAPEALKSADKALQFDPKNPAYLLSRAQILSRLGHSAEAARIDHDVLARTDLAPLLKARGLCLQADLTIATHGDDQQAVDLRLAAIKAATPLVDDHRVGIRRQAKRVLLDAHLGAANDIAWGAWQQKPQIVPKWIKQADTLAVDLVEHEEADPALRLEVAQQAIHASAGTHGKWNPSEFAHLVGESGKKLLDSTDDSLRRERLQWELGLAFSDSLEVAQARGMNEHSLSDGMAALAYLQQGVRHRQPLAEDSDRLGWVYYRIGVIHAVVKKDHATAVTWFDRSLPLLERPSAANMGRPDTGRRGEALVSMGISYWETGHRDDALRLTEQGVKWMDQAVAAKQLDDKALAIPYGNLATMHRELGHEDKARSFADLAAQHETQRR